MTKIIVKVALAILVSYLFIAAPFDAANKMAMGIKNQPSITNFWLILMMLPAPVITFVVAVRNR